jgi:hypothetical protein
VTGYENELNRQRDQEESNRQAMMREEERQRQVEKSVHAYDEVKSGKRSGKAIFIDGVSPSPIDGNTMYIRKEGKYKTIEDIINPDYTQKHMTDPAFQNAAFNSKITTRTRYFYPKHLDEILPDIIIDDVSIPHEGSTKEGWIITRQVKTQRSNRVNALDNWRKRW